MNEKRNEMIAEIEKIQKEINDTCFKLGQIFLTHELNEVEAKELKHEALNLVKRAKNLSANLPKEEVDGSTRG